MNIRWGNELHFLLGFSITLWLEKCRRPRLIRTKTPTKNCLFYYYFLVSNNIYALCADHEVWLFGGAQACRRWCKHLQVSVHD